LLANPPTHPPTANCRARAGQSLPPTPASWRRWG
jgi:hypothetical protein